MDALEELVARERIRQLAFRYAMAVDGKDIDGLAELFVHDVRNGRFGEGREGVKTYYDNVLRTFHCSMHLVANHIIEFDDDDHAHGVVYCRAHHHVLETDHWFDKALAYWDTYERAGDEWLFRRRRLKSWYREEFGLRVEAAPEGGGAERGSRMPEAFESFDAFWARPPRPLPSA